MVHAAWLRMVSCQTDPVFGNGGLGGLVAQGRGTSGCIMGLGLLAFKLEGVVMLPRFTPVEDVGLGAGNMPDHGSSLELTMVQGQLATCLPIPLLGGKADPG